MKNSTDEKLKVMAVVCHPADAIDGAGGTLCHHVERGDEVTVVVCTHGVETHDWEGITAFQFGGDLSKLDPREAVGRKEKEVVNGMAILGVKDIRFLRFSDDLLIATPELIHAIARIMAEVQPHLLITHNPTEGAGLADIGHAESAIAALKSRHLANTPKFLSKPIGRRFPFQVFMMTMNGETTQLTAEGTRHGTVLVDISDVVERKVRAMDCLKSQFYPGHLARKVIEGVNGRMGLHWKMDYAEGFQALNPEPCRYLPANDYLRDLATTPLDKIVQRMRIRVTDVPFEGPAKTP